MNEHFRVFGENANAILIRKLFIFGALGLFARALLSLCSYGSNDIEIWQRFASELDSHSLTELFVLDSAANHPPLPFYFAWFAQKTAGFVGIRFEVVFKLATIAADVGIATVLLFWQRALAKSSEGALSFIATLWSLNLILISSFHGNTDSICIFFLLLSIFLLLETRHPIGAGLAFACSLNVKIIPLIVVIPLLLSIEDRRKRRHFLFGLLSTVIPYAILWNSSFPLFFERVLGYHPIIEPWGFNFIFFELAAAFPSLHWIVGWYHSNGFLIILAGILILSLINFSRFRIKPFQTTTISLGIWFLLASGFGLQYVVYLTPFFILHNPWGGFLYSLLSGIFLLSNYSDFLTSEFPLHTIHTHSFSHVTALLGFAVWLYTFIYLASILDHRERGGNPSAF